MLRIERRLPCVTGAPSSATAPAPTMSYAAMARSQANKPAATGSENTAPVGFSMPPSLSAPPKGKGSDGRGATGDMADAVDSNTKSAVATWLMQRSPPFFLVDVMIEEGMKYRSL